MQRRAGGRQQLGRGGGRRRRDLEEIYEPYLIQRGFLKRTASGRVLTERSYQHFNVKPPAGPKQLL